MNAQQRAAAREQLARARAVHGWAFRLQGPRDQPAQFIRDHHAIHQATAGTCRPCDQAARWEADRAEAAAIKVFLDGGPCPPQHHGSYALARKQLGLPPEPAAASKEDL